MSGSSLRDRLLTHQGARALHSPVGLRGRASPWPSWRGVAGLPVVAAAVVGIAVWGANAWRLLPHGARPERIDPFTLHDPWRRFVQEALQSRRPLRPGRRTGARGAAARPPARDRRAGERRCGAVLARRPAGRGPRGGPPGHRHRRARPADRRARDRERRAGRRRARPGAGSAAGVADGPAGGGRPARRRSSTAPRPSCASSTPASARRWPARSSCRPTPAPTPRATRWPG